MLANRIVRQLTCNILPHSPYAYMYPSIALLTPTQYFFSVKYKDEGAEHLGNETKKRSNDRPRKSGSLGGQGNRDSKNSQSSELSKILKMYRIRQSSNQGSYNQNFAECCKLVASQYRKDNRNEFLEHREELEKILKEIPTLDFQSFQLLQLLNVLDFLRVTGRIQTLTHSRIYQVSLNKVFSIITRYLKEGGDIPLNELLVLFSKITPLYYPQTASLSFRILERLRAEVAQRGVLPFPVYQLFVTVKSLSKKSFLSFADKLILQTILDDLNKREKEIDKSLIIQLAKALVDLDFAATLADNHTLTICENILSKALNIIQKSQGAQFTHYPLQCPKNQIPQHQRMVAIIYERSIRRMAHPHLNSYPFNTLRQCLKHLNHSILSEDDKITVLDRLQTMIEARSPNARNDLEIEIAQLIESGFFDSVGDKLNEMIEDPTFQFKWTLPYQFSLRGLVFPASKIQEKGTRAYIFRPQLTFLKAAVAIAIQSRLQPSNLQLAQFNKLATENIQKASWEEHGLQWLVKISIVNPKIVKAFHKEYSHLYLKRVEPNEQDIKQDYSLGLGDNIRNLAYWQYFFTVTEVDQNMPSETLYKMSMAVFSLCSSRQVNKMNTEVDVKPALLACLLVKASIGLDKITTRQQQLYTNNMVNLILLYFYELYNGSDSFAELYMRSVLQVIRNIGKLKKGALPQAYYLLMKIISIKSKKIYNSWYMTQIVQQIMQNPIIFGADEQNQHLKIAVIRMALQKNILSYLTLPRINQSFLSESQSQHLSTLIRKFKITTVTHQSLVFILRIASLPVSTLQNYQSEIEGIIQSASLHQLEQYLVSFSLQRNKTSDSILVKLVQELIKKIIVAEIDFLRIISNIHSALLQIDPQLLSNLLQDIASKLCLDPSALLLVDHHRFLSVLSQYNVDLSKYGPALLEYAIKNKDRGSYILDIVHELSRHEQLRDIDFGLLGNYFMLQPDSYLQVLALYQLSIQDIEDRLVKVSKFQMIPVSDALITHYFESKYSLRFNKHQKGQSLLINALPNLQHLIGLLQKHGVPVQISSIGSDKVYLVGQQFVWAMADKRRVNEAKMMERALRFLYPNRQITLLGLNEDKRSLEQLLSSITSSLSLTIQDLQSISRQLSQS